VIAAEILGAERALAAVEQMPDAVEDGLARALARLARDLESAAARKLSGEALQSRSGALRASLEASLAIREGAVAATLASASPYAAFQEYGFHGVESVRAALRTIRQAFGRPLRRGAEQIPVRAHDRRVDYPAHSFLRSALAELAPAVAPVFSAAVGEAIDA